MSDFSNPRIPRLLVGLTATSMRCHVLGATLTTLLILATAWVWSWNYSMNDADSSGVTELSDAISLINDAEQWRQQYTENYEHSGLIDARVASIGNWLPRQLEWSEMEAAVRSSIKQSGLQMRSIQQGKRHVGLRVGVITARCEVEGSYESLCRFLNDISTEKYTIHCSELAVARAEANKDQPSMSHCQGSITLRMPFAASTSTAGKLLPSEEPNAS
ncbi:MAG: hypothetical protein AB8B91_06350 [Rubripirellula sp.]